MSAAVERIMDTAQAKSLLADVWNDDQVDTLCDNSLSIGDWRDAIHQELHALKSKLDALAGELEYAGLFTATAKVREMAKEL